MNPSPLTTTTSSGLLDEARTRPHVPSSTVTRTDCHYRMAKPAAMREYRTTPPLSSTFNKSPIAYVPNCPRETPASYTYSPPPSAG